MHKQPPDRETRRIQDERRDEAYFRDRDEARLDGEKKTAHLRGLRMAKEALAREQAVALAAVKPAKKKA